MRREGLQVSPETEAILTRMGAGRGSAAKSEAGISRRGFIKWIVVGSLAGSVVDVVILTNKDASKLVFSGLEPVVEWIAGSEKIVTGDQTVEKRNVQEKDSGVKKVERPSCYINASSSDSSFHPDCFKDNGNL